MSSIHLTLEAARAYSGRPTTDKINKDDLFMMLLGRLSYYRQKLGITNQNWLIALGFLNVDQNNNEYRLNIADFSRPIKVEYYNETYRNEDGPEVEIIGLQNSNRYSNSSSYSNFYDDDRIGTSSARVASAIAFYGMPPADVTVRLIPRPTQAATYKIYYEPTAISGQIPTFAEDPALMTQFHDMLAVATALMALPRCGYDQNTFVQYRETLVMELTRLEAVFDQFRLTRKHDDTRLRRPFTPGGRGNWRS